MDIIRINDLTLDWLIGVYAHERANRQPLVINVELEADLSPGTTTDRIEDTLSYEDIYKKICALAEHSDYYLIEALAEAIAGLCLADSRVMMARVKVDKPGIFSHVRSAGVEVVRHRA